LLTASYGHGWLEGQEAWEEKELLKDGAINSLAFLVAA